MVIDDGKYSSYSATILNGGTSSQTVQAELTAVQTAAVPLGNHHYDVKVTLSNGHVITPARGAWFVT